MNTGIERAFRILWGPALENVLDFTTPVAGTRPTFFRQPRPQSEQVPSGASTLAWITGRYFRLRVAAQWFGAPQNFGAAGLQAFLDWAMDSNTFTLVPNLLTPTLTVPGCYLDGPFTDLSPSVEQGEVQQLDLTILHPTVDLGIAWRGLFFEYAAGGSLSDPLHLNFSRGSIGYEITPSGYLLNHPAGSVCDGHYPNGNLTGIVGTGQQVTLLEMAVANDILNPEALDNASWDKTTNVTVTANNAKAPDQNLTADLVVETVTNGVHCIASNSFAVAASDVQTGLVFARGGGRNKGTVYFGDGIGAAGANRFGVSYDLSLGTIAATTLGTGTLQASAIVPMAGGWFMIWIRGSLGGPTTSFLNLRLFDNTGAGSYAGDAVSGTYFWGATAVHGGANIVASYTPTISSADKLTAPYAAPVQAQWMYISIIENGDAWDTTANSKGIVLLGTAMRIMFFKEGAGVGYRALFDNGAGVQVRSPGGSAMQPNVGDRLEAFIILYSDGSIECHQSINGGAPTLYARSAADAPSLTQFGLIAFGTARPSDQLADGVCAVSSVKVGPFNAGGVGSVASLAQARAA